MPQPKEMLMMAGTSHPDLCDKISRILTKDFVDVDVDARSNGEKLISVNESVREAGVFVVQTGSPNVNDMLMELMFLLTTCKAKSAASVCAVVPHFPYARQRAESESSRYPFAARVVAKMIENAGADRLITMDLHANQIQGCFNIPVDNLIAEPSITKYVRDNFDTDQLVIVSPDAGGAKRSTSQADMLNCGVALIHKERVHKNDSDGLTLVGSVEGKVAVIIDDMADTCSTIVKAASVLLGAGANEVHAVAVHGLLSDEGVRKIMKSPIVTLAVTNTIPVQHRQKDCPKLRIIDVSAIFSEAMRRAHNGESISYLYSHIPLSINTLDWRTPS